MFPPENSQACRYLVPLTVCMNLLLMLTGCDLGGRTVSGFSQSSTSFGGGTVDGVPGIDFGTVDRITLLAGPPEGVTFVVWSDLSSSGGHAGTRSGASGREAYYEGKMTGSDGLQVAFSVDTTDGISGMLSFEDEDLKFNAGDGALILVSTASGKLRAQQSEFVISQLPGDHTKLPEFARSNETISAFFQPPPGSAETASQ